MSSFFRFFLSYSIIRSLTGGRGILGLLLFLCLGWIILFFLIPIFLFSGVRLAFVCVLIGFVIVSLVR
jgi:predicted membrane channel-forming protein YqfA (hemolysin III family)